MRHLRATRPALRILGAPLPIQAQDASPSNTDTARILTTDIAMRPLMLIFLTVFAFPAHAGKLFACRDASGHVAFVDAACPNLGERHELALPSPPKTSKAPADVDAEQIAAWDKASRSRLPASLGGTSRGSTGTAARNHAASSNRHDACSAARSARSKAERERSFQMGFDERRRLSDAVLSACGLR
jgi:hypothetical protein